MWEGTSLIDNVTPIVVLMSVNRAKSAKKSANKKTGVMAQTYILRQDVAPQAAHGQGLDPAICGDCPMRSPASGGNNACYVNIWRGGNQVWGAYKRGNARSRQEGEIALQKSGLALRIGTYGDPAAAPMSLWEGLIALAKGHRGYTHQWRQPRVQEYRTRMQASADTPEDRAEANAMGWRTFRVRLEDGEVLPGEVVCPASEEAGKKLQCFQCRQCSGTEGRRSKVDVVIAVHGATKKRKVR